MSNPKQEVFRYFGGFPQDPRLKLVTNEISNDVPSEPTNFYDVLEKVRRKQTLKSYTEEELENELNERRSKKQKAEEDGEIMFLPSAMNTLGAKVDSNHFILFEEQNPENIVGKIDKKQLADLCSSIEIKEELKNRSFKREKETKER